MTTLTVNIPNEKDLPIVEELLNKLGLDFEIDTDEDYVFSKEEIDELEKDSEDYISGKTTARDWNDIKEDLKRAHDKAS